MSEATQEGASVQERLESLLAAQEAPMEAETNPPAEIPEGPEEEEELETPAEEEEETEDAPEESESRIELSDLAEYLGIESDKLDVDDDGKVSVRTKVDGQEGRAKLSDLIKSYQLEGHLNKQNMEVAEQRKALQAKQADLEAQYQQRLQLAEDIAKVAQEDLLADYQKVDWQTLRAEDPAEYAARLADYQARHGALNQRLTQVQQERQRAAQTSQQGFQSNLREEATKLAQAIPEWSKPEVAETEKKALRDYGVKAGFKPEELADVSDHRAIVLLRKAMLYDQLQGKKPEVEKKVRATPKLAKPGQARTKEEGKSAELKKLKAKVRNKQASVADWLLATGKV